MKKTLISICALVVISTVVHAQHIGYTVGELLSERQNLEFVDYEGASALREDFEGDRYNLYIYIDTKESVEDNLINMTLAVCPQEYGNIMIGKLHDTGFYYRELWYWYNYSYYLPDGDVITVVYDGFYDKENELFIIAIYPEFELEE